MLKRSPWPVVLQLIPSLSAGGAERTVIEMAEAITLGGGRALVLSRGGRLEEELREAGGELIRFPANTKNPASMLWNAVRIAAIVRDRGVSLLHARSRAPAWSAFAATRRSRRPLVATYHGIYNQSGKLKAFYNGVMTRGDAVICNSRYTADAVTGRHPGVAGRITVIHRGVDLTRFDPETVSPHRVQALRSRWAIPAGGKVILVPGRLTRWKGQQVVIDAASLSGVPDAALRDAVFVLAGDDQGRSGYRAELVDVIERRGLTGRVIVPGHCDDMPAAYALAQLTVIPSVAPEAFGRVSIEAQAMGCPVIASNIGALPETILPEKHLFSQPHSAGASGAVTETPSLTVSPWLFEPGSAKALHASLVAALALNEDALRPLAIRLRDNVRLHFSKRQLQQKTLGVYDRLLGTQLAETFAKAIGK